MTKDSGMSKSEAVRQILREHGVDLPPKRIAQLLRSQYNISLNKAQTQQLSNLKYTIKREWEEKGDKTVYEQEQTINQSRASLDETDVAIRLSFALKSTMEEIKKKGVSQQVIDRALKKVLSNFYNTL